MLRRQNLDFAREEQNWERCEGQGVVNFVGPLEVGISTNSSSIKGFTLYLKVEGSSNIYKLGG